MIMHAFMLTHSGLWTLRYFATLPLRKIHCAYELKPFAAFERKSVKSTNRLIQRYRQLKKLSKRRRLRRLPAL